MIRFQIYMVSKLRITNVCCKETPSQDWMKFTFLPALCWKSAKLFVVSHPRIYNNSVCFLKRGASMPSTQSYAVGTSLRHVSKVSEIS